MVPEEFMAMFPEMLLPADQMQAWLRTRTGAIVGRKTAERFHWKIGDRVPILSSIWAKGDGTTSTLQAVEVLKAAFSQLSYLIEVTYEVLPHVIDVEAAMADILRRGSDNGA